MSDNADLLKGLSSSAAKQRLEEDGLNTLPSAKPRSLLAIAWTILSEPMFILLIACGSIYLLLGSNEDAYILLGSVVIIMAMSFVQERKSERALEALRDLSSPRALVLRDDQQVRIAGQDVVTGDLLFLAEGDRVPADAVLVASQNMTIDESLLTGESVSVRKSASHEAMSEMVQPGGDDTPCVYSGTLVVQGSGKARVLATGEKTALGRIGKALYSLKSESSHLQKETSHAVKVVALWSIILVIILALWYGFTRDDWLNGILAGLTMAMSLLPAELPLILTIFLGLGAWRIAKKKVLTRQISAIEMLGAATVLCVDKTGTLTQNKMALAQIIANDEVHNFNPLTAENHNNTADTFAEKFHETLEFSMLSSHRDPFDAMEKAILHVGLDVLAGSEHLHNTWTLIEDYPLTPELLAMSRVWQSPDSADFVIAAKGAPEAIIDLCHLSDQQTYHINSHVNRAAEQGLRVLAIAKARFKKPDLPKLQHDFDFQFIGLIALADPLRPTAKAAITECLTAGIRVVMITGDYPATALSIAAQCGLDVQNGVLTGSQIDDLNEAQLLKRLQQVNVYCRVQPEQKLRLVMALKHGKEIVAMTGDGVNDAPALKAAHIGIAMGGRGTDVARESAALVLLNDDFSALVAAIRLGRRIVDNIRKAVVFVIAAHIPIAGMSMLPVMMGWPLILLPVHIVFFELMVDPTCSVVFEAEQEESNVMQRSPRLANAKIFDKKLLMRGLQQGVILLLILLAVYLLAQWVKLPAEQARALTFSAMIIGDIWLIFINRSWSLSLYHTLKLPNRALWWVVLCALLMLALALFLPFMNRLFHFEAPPIEYLVMMITAVSGILLLVASITTQSKQDKNL
ncbi:cation-translocating P-type ATPase [Pseudoalteromonas tunicata]|uniref:cation-translocating P-type ATPase n=1 Tax=Pseudoalteromonas tunicata TaxID=314281 RepID=UPI00273D6D90|nr:cation-translocating P-type ATPase [Pseudoalteromonas tunicata]MDP4983856.1 cation-translocating P-type ATPase [Pseudoalteromonas tunicata]